MNAMELLRAKRYMEATLECQRRLGENPEDWAAVGTLGSVYRAIGKYEEALPLFERIGEMEQRQEPTPGHPGRQETISCLYWMIGNHERGLQIAFDLAKKVLKGSVKYGDISGAVTQGLLLYYMGLTANNQEAASFAIKFMQNRVKRSAIRSWPGPVARYYLDELSFEEVLEAATGKRDLAGATAVAHEDFLSRRQLCVALFHDGVRYRARGARAECMVRMRQCCALEDPLIQQEWYLARYEVGRAGSQ